MNEIFISKLVTFVNEDIIYYYLYSRKVIDEKSKKKIESVSTKSSRKYQLMETVKLLSSKSKRKYR